MTEGINLSNLARLMLRWEEMRKRLDEVEEAIKDTVLQLQKTQTVGNVRATYSNPRNRYDYERPAKALLYDEATRAKAQLAILEHTEKVVNWKATCEALSVEPIVTPGEGPGSVSIKLLG